MMHRILVACLASVIVSGCVTTQTVAQDYPRYPVETQRRHDCVSPSGYRRRCPPDKDILDKLGEQRREVRRIEREVNSIKRDMQRFDRLFK